MHITDALLSPTVGITLCAASAATIVYSVKKDELCEKKVPVIGVMGAFIFAAQMLNFTIPATGSSGHISGGILLAAMLGSAPALLSMSAILIIQCLFFADGGLLALGCNIFNLGVVPCLLVYPLVFKPFVKKNITPAKITAASVLASIISLQMGAFCVVLETLASGVAELPLTAFLLLMQPIHLVIGIVEGVVTATILCFVFKMRPEIMESASKSATDTVIAFAVMALFAGGVLSLFASQNPDGLEWSLQKLTGGAEFAESVPLATAFLAEWETSTAGIAGGILTFLLAAISAFVISAVKRRKFHETPNP